MQAFYGQGYVTLLVSLAVFAPGVQVAAALRSRKFADWLLAGTWLAIVLMVATIIYSRNLILQTVLTVFVVPTMYLLFARHAVPGANKAEAQEEPVAHPGHPDLIAK